MNKIKLTIAGKKYDAYFGIGFMQKAIKEERPEESNIMNIPTYPLMAHAIAYGFERKGVDSPISKYDIFDWIDSVGINSDEVKSESKKFMKAFLESMKVHLPESEKEINKALKAFEEKKKVSKSGKKTGRKTS